MNQITEQLLMKSLDQFFDNEIYFNTMLDILVHRDSVSLRLLEFMFTKYSKRHETILCIDGLPISVAQIYRQGLAIHGKARYDCFKRHQRVVFSKHSQQIETTLGQLHFFKHILPTGVIEFARKHAAEIRAEMTETLAKPAPVPATALAPTAKKLLVGQVRVGRLTVSI